MVTAGKVEREYRDSDGLDMVAMLYKNAATASMVKTLSTAYACVCARGICTYDKQALVTDDYP